MHFLRSLRHRSSSLVFKDRFYHVTFKVGTFCGRRCRSFLLCSFCVLAVSHVFWNDILHFLYGRSWWWILSDVFLLFSTLSLCFDMDFFEIWFLALLSLADFLVTDSQLENIFWTRRSSFLTPARLGWKRRINQLLQVLTQSPVITGTYPSQLATVE